MAFLAEQQRSVAEKLAALDKSFAPSVSTALVSAFEARLCTMATHLNDIVQSYTNAIDYLEHMLRTQIIAAIGKEVTPPMLSAYMRFHHRRLFAKEFQPVFFAHSIRYDLNAPEVLP